MGCFNPRPHEGSDSFSVALISRRCLFQSTPPRGERPHRAHNLRRVDVSIHAPTRGATSMAASWLMLSIVSIHAPTRGATSVIRGYSLLKCFNPRPHEGSDRAWLVLQREMEFQSTPPRGERLAIFCQIIKLFYVSIHAPTRGATGIPLIVFGWMVVSIHAPTRGATPRRTQSISMSGFNPRPHEGSDRSALP